MLKARVKGVFHAYLLTKNRIKKLYYPVRYLNFDLLANFFILHLITILPR